mgnify:CR=1 FL=1
MLIENAVSSHCHRRSENLLHSCLLPLFCTLLLGGCATAASNHRDPSLDKLGDFASVAPFYSALDALQSGQDKKPVTVLQIGDSHSASDAFSGQMRSLLQKDFGDAGRGFLQPGVPFRYYHPAQVTVSSTGWAPISAFSKNTTGPWGIALIRQHADKAASMTLTADESGGIGSGKVEFLGQRGGGQLVVETDDGSRTIIPTDSLEKSSSMWLRMPVTPNTHSVSVSAVGDGPVDILGWEVQKGSQTKAAPGVLYSNLGIGGSTIDILNKIDPKILSEEMKLLNPSLLIVAFGTNEGFNDKTDFASYSARYEQLIKKLQTAAPWAGIAVLLPLDGVHKEAHAPSVRSCSGLAPTGSGFATPPAMNTVRQAQLSIARRNKWKQWDWRQAMADSAHPDGRCTILVWGTRTPPAAAKDHVHLLQTGYRQTAQSFYNDLMSGYRLWRSLKHKK